MQATLMLLGAGALAGAMNSLAGGGSFVTLPALIAAGLPSVNANASSTVALWPGAVVGASTYYSGLRRVCGANPVHLFAVTVAGGIGGSLLLLLTPSAAFDKVLPFLLLLATVAIAAGRRVGDWMRGRLARLSWLVLVVQFGLGLYGGYFGGAVGLLMMAAWSLFGEGDIKALNGTRMLYVTAANTAALVLFVAAGAVWWAQTVPTLLGGVLGGFAGARLGRWLPGGVIRALTIVATATITALFFARAYGWFR